MSSSGRRIIPAVNRTRSLAIWCAYIEAQFDPGKDIVVTAEEFVPERTPKQRNSMFGVAYKALMEQMGLAGEREKEQLHEMMCGEYWGWRWKQMLGGRKRVPIRTTTTNEHGERDVLTTRQQMAFYAWLQQRAAEYGYEIPEPNAEWHRRAEREAELADQARRAG